ncbi:hypothetical protein U1Q18_045492 [Sarracenia purpurea var. burkii]
MIFQIWFSFIYVPRPRKDDDEVFDLVEENNDDLQDTNAEDSDMEILDFREEDESLGRITAESRKPFQSSSIRKGFERERPRIYLVKTKTSASW